MVSLTFKTALTWHHLCPEAQLLVKIIIKIMYKCEKYISDMWVYKDVRGREIVKIM